LNFDDFAARYGSRVLQKLPAEDRAKAINTLADLLIIKQAAILDANDKDIDKATKEGTAAPLISRLSLTPAKLKSLATGKSDINVKHEFLVSTRLPFILKKIFTNYKFFGSYNKYKYIVL